MISEQLLSIVRCPDCRSALTVARAAARGGPDLVCGGCGRAFPGTEASWLDLRPSHTFAEATKYLDEALHADARHETVSPPLLSAGVRNDMLRAFLSLEPSDRVVDLGCGSGRAVLWNQDRQAYLVGVDVAPFFAEEARAQADLLVGDLRQLPVADGTFSKAFSLDVFEHLSRDSLAGMLREAHRVLGPKGQLFVYSHVRRNSRLALGLRAINRLARLLDRWELIDLRQERLRKSDHLNPLADIPDLEALVHETGFRIARIRYYTPLIGGVVENLLMRLAEKQLARRAHGGSTPPGSDVTSPEAALKTARLGAKARIARRGPLYIGLWWLTRLMKLDVVLFGRVRSGPFFALLEKT